MHVQLIDHDYSYAKAMKLYKNGLCLVDDIWDMKSKHFILWQKAQGKFGPLDKKANAWDLITGSFPDEWRDIL